MTAVDGWTAGGPDLLTVAADLSGAGCRLRPGGFGMGAQARAHQLELLLGLLLLLGLRLKRLLPQLLPASYCTRPSERLQTPATAGCLNCRRQPSAAASPVARAALGVFNEAAVEGVGLGCRQPLVLRLQRRQRRGRALLPPTPVQLRIAHESPRPQRPTRDKSPSLPGRRHHERLAGAIGGQVALGEVPTCMQ